MTSDLHPKIRNPRVASATAVFGSRKSSPLLALLAVVFLATAKPLDAQEGTNAPVITREGKKNRIIFYNDSEPTPTPGTSPAPATLPPSATAPAEVVPPRGREATAADTQPVAPARTPGEPAQKELPNEITPLEISSTPVSTPPLGARETATPQPSVAPSQNASALSAGEPTDASTAIGAGTPALFVADTTPSPSPTPPSVQPSQNLSAVTAGEQPQAQATPSTPVVAQETATPAPSVAPSPAAEVTQPAVATASAIQENTPEVVKTEAPATPAPDETPAASAETVSSASAPTAPVPDATATDVLAEASSANLSPNPSGPSTPPAPSQSVTVNLINKLVQRGILSKEDAASMIAQAEAEAQVAREQAQADMFAIAQVTAARAASDQAVAEANAAPAQESVNVTYIPEPVKTQIKEEVKLEIFDEARGAGNSKTAGLLGPQIFLPEWVGRVRPFADVRFRFEGDYYPQGNDSTGAFPNFNAINTGAPYDVTGNQFAPQYNVDQARNRFRFRARFGAEFDLNDNITMGLRVATGENNSPVSANQTIGLANQGQGGQFSKYAIWLDRAFLKWDIGEDANKSLSVLVGRFDNPFFSTNLIYSDELGFDGAAFTLKYEVTDGVVPFLTAGAFAVFNTDLNFSSNQPTKFESYDKYLYAVQAGVDWTISKDWQAKVAASYYYYYNIEGQLSSPYTPQNASDAGDTDNSRPSFAQKGNTYMALRNIVPDASNDFGTINQYQYYGLATPFQDVALTARIDYNGFEPVQVSLIGEFIQNVAFNKGSIDAVAVNNRGSIDVDELDTIGSFEGSPTAWLVELRVGTPALAKRWDWNVNFGYRYIGSDSVVDGFNDSNFGLGGTNMQGFTVGGALALSPNVWVALRWFGSDNIAGPSYKLNIIQLDLNAKF